MTLTEKDHKKRKTQNKNKFGLNTERIKKGNEIVDRIAAETKYIPGILQQKDTNRKYDIINERKLELHDKYKERITAGDYTRISEDWKNRQKQWAKMMHTEVLVESLPQRKDSHANLTCKMMTGTIWTNKLKKRLKMTDDDTCPECNKQKRYQYQSQSTTGRYWRFANDRRT